MSVIEEIKRLEIDARQEADRRFHRLAEEIATGEKPDPADVKLALDQCVRTPDELDAEIGRIRLRRHLHSQLAEVPELENALADVDAKLREFDARRQKTVAELNSEEDQLAWRRSQVAARLQEASRARQKLVETSLHLPEIRELRKRKGEVHRKLMDARKRHDDASAWLRALPEHGTDDGQRRRQLFATMRDEAKVEMEDGQRRVAELDEEIARIDNQAIRLSDGEPLDTSVLCRRQ